MRKILLPMKKAAIYLVALLLALFPLAALEPAGNIYAAGENQRGISAVREASGRTPVSTALGVSPLSEAVRKAESEASAQEAAGALTAGAARKADPAALDLSSAEAAAGQTGAGKPEAEESYLAFDQLTVPEIESARIDAQNTLLAKRESMDREWLAAKQEKMEEARQQAAAAAAAQKKSSQSSGAGSGASVKSGAGTKETSGGADLGKFKLTAYCPCYQCSRGWGGMTSSGRRAEARHTIAVDPSVIPEGTHVIINGQEYVAEDTGGGVRGNHIDIFYESHSDALNFGVRYAEVYTAD